MTVFIKEVKELTLNDEDVLVSFDVCSLFLTAHVMFTVETFKKLLQKDPILLDHAPFRMDEVRALVRFCLTNAYLTSKGDFYQQMLRTAMSASVSVKTGNVTMKNVKRRALESSEPSPKLFLRYGGGCLRVLDREHVQRFLQHLNNVETSLQFAAEVEVVGFVPFLNTLVNRSSNGSTPLFQGTAEGGYSASLPYYSMLDFRVAAGEHPLPLLRTRVFYLKELTVAHQTDGIHT
ncbi:uncharacterized protein [Dermacentor albipictus]|uniref:uncharacterized protein n=1 Tax=Dermacentor albipictus TaxID=60249 RepID=UPI0038FBEAD3